MVRKSQSSMEYLIVFGVAIAMTAPLLIIYVTQTGNIRTDITVAEAEKVSNKLIDYAETVYYIGEPAQKTLEIYFPNGIERVTIASNSITFNITTTDLTYELVKETTSGVVLNGSIRDFSGLHIITFTSVGNTVNIVDK